MAYILKQITATRLTLSNVVQPILTAGIMVVVFDRALTVGMVVGMLSRV